SLRFRCLDWNIQGLGDQFLTRSLSTLVWSREFEGFFGAPLNALGTLWIVFALIADLRQCSGRIDRYSAEITSLDTPRAAITLGGIDVNDSCNWILRQGIPRTDNHTGGIFTST